MEQFEKYFLIVVGLVVALFLVVLVGHVWEIGRRIYYRLAAWACGWSKEEKFKRETAWLDRQ